MSEPCWKCHGVGSVQEPVCGWCGDDVLHSHCDDTWYRTVRCDACRLSDSEEFELHRLYEEMIKDIAENGGDWPVFTGGSD
jgi:hypothetical protein